MGISNSRAADNRRKILAGIRGRATTGDVFYVDSGGTGASDTAGRGKTPSVPFATIDFAVGEATANQGDVIIVMAGHAETVANATDWAMDKAGISVIGLGIGTLRPTITMSAVGSSIVISAADCVIENILFLTEADNTIVVEVTATDCSIVDCEFRARIAATARQWVDAIDIGGAAANACDRTLVSGCKFTTPGVGSTAAIKLSEISEGVVIEDCRIFGDFSVAPIHNPTGFICTNLLVSDCHLDNITTAQLALEFISACTGMLVRNYYATDIAGAVGGVNPGSCDSYECFGTDTVDCSGLISPAACA